MKILDTTSGNSVEPKAVTPPNSPLKSNPSSISTTPDKQVETFTIQETKIKERRFRKFLRMAKESFQKIPFIPRILLLSIPFIIIISSIGIFTYKALTSTVDPTKISVPRNVLAAVQTKYSSLSLATISDPKTMESPLNGILMSRAEYEEMTANPPIAIMIENHWDARPQSGLAYADITYETLVEGGISRFMSIFWSNLPEYAGPVRSCRLYYIHWLLPFDALYAHIGGATTDSPNTNAMGALFTYNVKTVGFSDIYWRDNTRASPHNAYVNLEDIVDSAENLYSMESNFPSLSFKNDATYDERGDKGVYVQLWEGFTGGMDIEFKYNKETNTYSRYLAGEPHIDSLSGTQITVKTVIVEETSFTQSFDYEGHLIIGTTGQGDATIYMDGKKVDATWKKPAVIDRTKYYVRGTNQEIVFNRGQMWVIVAPKDLSVIEDR